MLEYFSDPILRAPTIGSMLVCMSAGLIGVVVFLRKQSLLGEALSHAAFPGVVMGVLIAGISGVSAFSSGFTVPVLIVLSAFVFALLGAWVIQYMVRELSVRSDTALCFVLSTFFGIGITLASQVQFSFSALYQQIPVYLYGQTATMTDRHVQVYFVLTAAVVLTVLLFYKEIQIIVFDHVYAKSLGVKSRLVDRLLLIIMTLAIVVGIRSVGVVLMSAMLIAPAVAARQWTNRLSVLLTLSAIFGLVSGFLGLYLSSEITAALAAYYPRERLSLPAGPMIVLVGAFFCLFSLLFSPKRGLLLRYLRIVRFRYKCVCENLLKAMWRFGPEKAISFAEVTRFQTGSDLYLRFVMMRLSHQGWIIKERDDHFRLTCEGVRWAANIVRLHRLWEVYLADYLGVGAERVHRSAEEMEHILTPELEEELTLLLKDPKKDPHKQPIPIIKPAR